MTFFVFCRALKDLEEKRSHLSMVGGRTGPNSVRDDQDFPFNIDELDIVPHFQRVSISGEDTLSQVRLSYGSLAL